jgi:G:T-mismatch repair DNA endonuclease (very short patch repair protein)
VSSTAWQVYLNDGAGFATTATSWSLPSFTGTGCGFSDGTSVFNSGTGFNFNTLDMNGDGKPDLVVTRAAGCTPSVSSTAWQVYLNDGGGFATTAASWSLPSFTGTGCGFSDGTSVFNSGTGFNFNTLDMNGDGKPDLVVTRAAGCTPSVSSTAWQVYLNDGGGFSTTATSWSLPSFTGTGCGFSDGTSVFNSGTGFNFNTLDMNGDGKPDLVVTRAAGCTPSVSSTAWQVYLNDGAGFATTAASWSLPSFTGTGCGFSDGTSVFNSGTGFNFNTLDMNGGGKPDLVVTRAASCTPTVNSTTWLVYPNQCQ